MAFRQSFQKKKPLRGPLCYICPKGVPFDSEGPLGIYCVPLCVPRSGRDEYNVPRGAGNILPQRAESRQSPSDSSALVLLRRKETRCRRRLCRTKGELLRRMGREGQRSQRAFGPQYMPPPLGVRYCNQLPRRGSVPRCPSGPEGNCNQLPQRGPEGGLLCLKGRGDVIY